MTQTFSDGDLILKVLKRQVLISNSLQSLLNWRNNVIWLQLCLSILANYMSLHLQMRIEEIRSFVLSFRSFVC